MTAKKNSRQVQTAVDPAAQPFQAARQGDSADTALGISMTMVQSASASASKRRLVEARGHLMSVQREFVDFSSEVQDSMKREAEELERKAIQVRAEAWAIEQESSTRAKVMRSQARMEAQVAVRIRDIAERSALAILDRIKEASDSMMDWAGIIGSDLTTMMKDEANEQAARKMSDIRAVEEAMEDEARALELLELTSRYKKDLAA